MLLLTCIDIVVDARTATPSSVAIWFTAINWIDELDGCYASDKCTAWTKLSWLVKFALPGYFAIVDVVSCIVQCSQTDSVKQTCFLQCQLPTL